VTSLAGLTRPQKRQKSSANFTTNTKPNREWRERQDWKALRVKMSISQEKTRWKLIEERLARDKAKKEEAEGKKAMKKKVAQAAKAEKQRLAEKQRVAPTQNVIDGNGGNDNRTVPEGFRPSDTDTSDDEHATNATNATHASESLSEILPPVGVEAPMCECCGRDCDVCEHHEQNPDTFPMFPVTTIDGLEVSQKCSFQ
jgi:hypothetical protein